MMKLEKEVKKIIAKVASVQDYLWDKEVQDKVNDLACKSLGLVKADYQKELKEIEFQIDLELEACYGDEM